MPRRSWPVLGVLLATAPSCSLVFDATALTEGDGAASGSSSGGPASTVTTTSAASGGGGDGSTTGAGAGDGGGGAGPTTTGQGGSTSSQGGGGGAPCVGATYCQAEGAAADLCFDFDGRDPFAGLQQDAPGGDGVTTSITHVDAPTLSCPGAARVAIEGQDFSPLSVNLGVDLEAGLDNFVFGFAVHRLTIDDPTAQNAVAVLKWYVGDTRCEAFVQMRDVDGEGFLSLYTQGNDGTGWVGTGSAYLTLPHPTIDTWTRVELEVDLDTTSSMALRAEGLEDEVDIDALCGPTTDHYDVDVGHHYTDRAQTTVYDDVTVLLDP